MYVHFQVIFKLANFHEIMQISTQTLALFNVGYSIFYGDTSEKMYTR
jgi:hypothetical protein